MECTGFSQLREYCLPIAYYTQVDLVAATAPETHDGDEYGCLSILLNIFAIFFTSEIFLQPILTTAAEYLTLRLATEQLNWFVSGCFVTSFHFTCLFALCTEFTMLRVYFFLMYLVRYILILRVRRTRTALGRFDSSCFLFLLHLLLLCFLVCYLFAVLALCR